jgi:hypothetical protein
MVMTLLVAGAFRRRAIMMIGSLNVGLETRCPGAAGTGGEQRT